MQRIPKPKIVSDIRTSSLDVFAPRQMRMNLSYDPDVTIPATRFVKLCAGIFFVAVLLGGSVVAPTTPSIAVADTSLAQAVGNEEREILETQLQELESQINEYQKQIIGYQKQGSSLKNEIAKLKSNIASLNLRIRAINLTLDDLDNQIDVTKSKISTAEETIVSNRNAIQILLTDLYESEQKSLIEIFLEKPRLSDFFEDVNGIELVRNNLQGVLAEVKDLHNQLVDQKELLALQRADAQTAKAYNDTVKKETELKEKEQNNLLSITKGQESKYQALLTKTKQTAAEIRSRIFQLLGGGELSFEEAYQFAKLASGATGVRPALILAVLDRESALGKNVGRCSYEKAMSPREKPIFLEIVRALNLNSETMMVSCPNADGAYGGAMGPAQFIPSTWKLYEEEIEKVTGRHVVSPWSNADAFVATALYLRDAGAANGSTSQERKAAAQYYAGRRWKSYLWTYGEAVVSRANRFQQDIDTIAG